MLRRCYNTSHIEYHNYGGRGITVCDRWHDIKNFVADMENTFKPGYQLSRIKNDKGYSLNNCEWATVSQNNKNKRNKAKFQSEMRYVSYHGNRWHVKLSFKTKHEAELAARDYQCVTI